MGEIKPLPFRIPMNPSEIRLAGPVHFRKGRFKRKR